jgi:hypothetical protein
VALVVPAQVIFFLYVLSNSCQYSQTDAIVVFSGAPNRSEKGYELIRNGYSDYLIISPAMPAELLHYDKKYGWEKSYKHIYETKARTTFENAIYVKRLIEKHHFKSVL